MNEQLWQECIDFHGHECIGLAIGFRAALYAKEEFCANERSEDEELVCVAENDACGVDAIQLITGCTFGKGNLIYRPTGKNAFSFFNRENGKKIRIIMKHGRMDGEDREAAQNFILDAPFEELFTTGEPAFALPERARIFVSRVCEECGESAPEHKMRFQQGKIVCLDCFKAYNRGWE